MKTRSELDKKYTWDLGLLYQSREDYLNDFEEVKKIANKLLLFKGKLNNKSDILEHFKLSDEMGLKIDRMGVYLSLRKEMDGKDIVALEDLAELENYLTDY